MSLLRRWFSPSPVVPPSAPPVLYPPPVPTPPTAQPLPAQRQASAHVPCPAGSRRSSLPRRLGALLAAGVPPSALSSHFTFVHASSGLLHSTCVRPAGTRRVSLADLASAPVCACVDPEVADDAVAAMYLSYLETYESFTDALRSLPKDPADALESLGALELELEDELDGAELSELRSRLMDEVVAASARLSTRLRSSPKVQEAYQRISAAALVERVSEDPDDLDPDEVALFLGDDDSSVGDFLMEVASAWGEAGMGLAGRHSGRAAAEGHYCDELYPETLTFDVVSPPERGVPVDVWLREDRDRARTAVLEDLFSRWEARYGAPLSQTDTVVSLPAHQRSVLEADVLLILDATRVNGTSVSLVPRHVGEVVSTYFGAGDGVTVVDLDPSDTPVVVETALALWDESSSGALSSLEAALGAARLV